MRVFQLHLESVNGSLKKRYPQAEFLGWELLRGFVSLGGLPARNDYAFLWPVCPSEMCEGPGIFLEFS